MNLILKIVQGPNAGAEIALIQGVNVKLGRSDECDVILTDQTLPDVACEIEVGAERVMLLLPGGGQERLDPLHVKVFETTAIAVGPADAPWGTLVWPDPNEKEPEEKPEEEEEKTEEKPRFRKLQWAVLIVLILVVILEFALWFFWPYLKEPVTKVRTYFHDKYEEWTADELEQAAQPVRKQTLDELATAYGVDCVLPPPHSSAKPILRGNLKTRADRLKLTASAYGIHPGCNLELTDDESLRNSTEELLRMVADDALKLESAENRQLALSGHLKNTEELTRVLTAIKADIPHVEKIDCSKVEIEPPPAPPAEPKNVPVVARPQTDIRVQPVPKGAITPDTEKEENTEAKEDVEAKKAKEAAEAARAAKALQQSQLPVVGIMLSPFPCLVLRNGSRVMEGAEFNGYVVSKIEEDKVLLKHGDTVLEWRP